MSKVLKKRKMDNVDTTNNENTNNENNKNIIKIDKNINFNKILYNSVKDKNLKIKKNTKDNKNKYNKYEKSFDNIFSFRKLFTRKEIHSIDIIVYHDENNDGMFSATIAYHYLKEANPTKNIELIPEKPGKFTFKDKIKDKNIIILDLSLNKDFLNQIMQLTKHCIVIDDHSKTLLNNKNIFNGYDHASCGYTWKFFYPKLNVPNTVLYIDSSDGKLFLPFIPSSYTTLYAQSTGIKFTHSKSEEMMQKKKSGEFFDE